jgi:hypothetical protein
MTNIFGPVSSEDWLTMIMLKKDIKDMHREDPVKYRLAIDKEISLLSYFKSLYQDSNSKENCHPKGDCQDVA